MNAAGDILTGAMINAGGTHTNAAFWDKLILGTGTTKIVVHGSLTPLNNIGDGVGYYFAELVIPGADQLRDLRAGVDFGGDVWRAATAVTVDSLGTIAW